VEDIVLISGGLSFFTAKNDVSPIKGTTMKVNILW
jgi:hypothetical protein